MTEQTETERNEAIKMLTNQFVIKEYELGGRLKKSLDLAISALKQQSEAERRIERAREYCKHTASETLGHTRPYIAACEDILEILEGKAE